MTGNAKLCDDKVMHPLALALQGMSFWHLLIGVGALIFTFAAVLAEPSASDDDFLGMSALAGAKVRAPAAALIVGSVSWAMLGRAFWRPRWSNILIPGLVGSLVIVLFDLMGWPVSFLVAGLVAYLLVVRSLDQASATEDAGS
jgi:hypothetical protein